MRERVFKKVALRDIDLSDRQFIFSYPLSPERLYPSIKQIGLICPVLLRRETPPHQVIDGIQRLLALQDLSHEYTEAFVYPDSTLQPLDAFHLTLQQNLHNRTLNPLEKGLALQKLLNQFGIGREEVIRHYMPLLGLPPAEKVLEDYLSLNGLEEEIKLVLVREEFPLPLAHQLARFSPEDRMALFRLARELRLGLNKMRELLRYLEELSLRDAVPIHVLLESQDCQQIIRNQRLTRPQRVEGLRKLLKQKRYPRLSQLEQSYSQAIKRLDLPPHIKIIAPPYFEGEGLTLEARFTDASDLKEIALSLQKIADREEITQLLGCLYNT